MMSSQIKTQPTPPESTSVIDPDLGTRPTWRGRLNSFWNALVAGVALVMGIVPHVLHHLGLLAGTALVAGSGGTALWGVLGLLASIPLLLRLRRRFNTWRAPAIGVLIFAAMFSVSTFIIGPAISGSGDATPAPAPVPVPGVNHQEHH